MNYLPRKGVLTIAFDDAYSDTCRYALDYLDKLGINSTIAVSPSLIAKKLEKRSVITKNRLKTLLKHGHEVASHTLTHQNLLKLSLKDKGKAFSEIIDSKKDLKGKLNYTPYSFVFPYINNNETKALRKLVEKHYKSSRTTLDKPFLNKLPIKNPHVIKGFAVMKKHSVSYLNRQVDSAIKKKGWLVEVFHLVGKKNTLSAHRPKPYRYFMHIDDFKQHIDDFKQHIDYVLSKNILVLSQKEVIKRF